MARSIKGPEEEEENVNYGEKKTNVTLILFRFTKPENTSIHLFYLYLVWLCHAMYDKNNLFFLMISLILTMKLYSETC